MARLARCVPAGNLTWSAARRVTSARLPPLAGDRCLVLRGRAETGRGPWIPLAYLTPRASHPVRSPLPAQSCLPCHRKPGCARPPERQPQLEPLLRGEGVGTSGEGPGQSAGLAALRRLGLRHQARRLLPGAPPGVAASEGAPLRAALGRAEVCLPQEPAAGRGQSLQNGGGGALPVPQAGPLLQPALSSAAGPVSPGSTAASRVGQCSLCCKLPETKKYQRPCRSACSSFFPVCPRPECALSCVSTRQPVHGPWYLSATDEMVENPP